VLKAQELPPLSARQERLLGVADKLTELIGFDVEDIEASVHATIRFVYYLHLLESSGGKECANEHQFQYRRWTVRAAYREEEVGLTMQVESSAAIDANCAHLKSCIDALDESEPQARLLKFRTTYDLARVFLAQSRFEDALALFRECQRIEPGRCKPDRFALSGRQAKPCIDEYATACATIVQSTRETEYAETPTGEFGTMSISDQQRSDYITELISEKKYDQALKECLTDALSSPESAGWSWIDSIHPQLLHYCARQPAESTGRIKQLLSDATAAWIEAKGGHEGLSAENIEELERRAATIEMFIIGDSSLEFMQVPDTETAADADSSQCQNTIVESQMLASEILALDVTKPALAMLQLSYCYLAGLWMLEKEQYQQAQVWFVRGQDAAKQFPAAQQQTAGPVMAQNAEKDKALKAALEAQVDVHARLADVCYQIEEGAEINDLSEDIDSILDAQVPIRFEFLEHFIVACLRQGNTSVFTRLVGAIATNQKLYQQLPEIHLALLQIASLLVVIRDTLMHLGIELGQELVSNSQSSELHGFNLDAVPAEQLEKLQSSVSELATLLLKIPVGSRKGVDIDLCTVLSCIPQAGSKHENEIERFCRMWGDPVYLILLGALLAEILHVGSTGDSVTGPSELHRLISFIVCKPESNDHLAMSDESSSNGVQSITASFINTTTDQGRKNIRHMQDIALIIFKCAVRVIPESANIWMYFSAVATGERLEGLFMPLFIEYLGLHTNVFAPDAVGRCMEQPWFQQRLPAMIQSLVELKMSGAAVVLHQCATDVDYGTAIPLLVQAFGKTEIDENVARFFWDPNIIEYAQYLSKLPTCSIEVEFPVPSEDMATSRSLV
ncbi:hypothetical protein IWW51_004043, partial [Coemansia sp. RSA 2702]